MDWYQVLAAFVLVIRAVESESDHWTFFLILVLALYFLQYGAVREWRACLVCDSWNIGSGVLESAFWRASFPGVDRASALAGSGLCLVPGKNLEEEGNRKGRLDRCGNLSVCRVSLLSGDSCVQCLDSRGGSECTDSGGNLPGNFCVVSGEALPAVDRGVRYDSDSGGFVYDEGILAEHFLVGLSSGSRNRTDCVRGSE